MKTTRFAALLAIWRIVNEALPYSQWEVYLMVNGKFTLWSMGSVNGDLPLRGFDPGCGIDPPHAGRWLGSDADQAAALGFEP